MIGANQLTENMTGLSAISRMRATAATTTHGMDRKGNFCAKSNNRDKNFTRCAKTVPRASSNGLSKRPSMFRMCVRSVTGRAASDEIKSRLEVSKSQRSGSEVPKTEHPASKKRIMNDAVAPSAAYPRPVVRNKLERERGSRSATSAPVPHDKPTPATAVGAIQGVRKHHKGSMTRI
mmetsp:Transcript_29841/g.36228  ORF Transcript_29841/g.36228 Transcript_29841/m.36228 type:complete len:177 (+) Transcript_29841:1261-1791(+)